jgi:hypothetical protein
MTPSGPAIPEKPIPGDRSFKVSGPAILSQGDGQKGTGK